MPKYKVFIDAKNFQIIEAQSVRHIHEQLNCLPVAVIPLDEKGRAKPQPGFYYPGEEPQTGNWETYDK